MEKSKNIKDLKKIKSYIGKIAKNTTKNKLRTVKQQINFDENVIGDINDNTNPYYANEQLNLINKELQQMNEDDRDIFIMYYYNNKKIKDISEIKNMKASTIKTRLHRTKKKLKKFLIRKVF